MRIIDYYTQDYSVEEIAEHTGIDVRVIEEVIRRHEKKKLKTIEMPELDEISDECDDVRDYLDIPIDLNNAAY